MHIYICIYIYSNHVATPKQIQNKTTTPTIYNISITHFSSLCWESVSETAGGCVPWLVPPSQRRHSHRPAHGSLHIVLFFGCQLGQAQLATPVLHPVGGIFC